MECTILWKDVHVNEQLMNSMYLQYIIKNISRLMEAARYCDLSRKRFNSGCLTADPLADKIICDLYLLGMSGHNPFAKVDLDKNTYKGSYISYSKLKKALNLLKDSGYIHVYKGVFSGTLKRMTRLEATEKLLNDVDAAIKSAGLSLYRATEIDLHPDYEPRLDVIIVDGSEPAIGTRLDRDTKVLKTSLKKINTNNLKHQISHFTADTTRVVLRRIFNSKDLKQGGRFYDGFWMSLPKEERAKILINGNPVIELDYGATHIKMLYDIATVSMPEDPYIIGGYDRKCVKTLLLMMVNSSSRSGAIKAYITEQKKRQHKALEKQLPFHSYEELDSLAEKLLAKHSAISSYFYSGIGISLQTQDAAMAERIMLRFIRATGGRTAILPVHESFIVDKRYEDDLMEIMLDEFKNSIVKQAIAKKEAAPMADEQYRKYIRSDACFVRTACVIKAIDNFVTDSKGKYDKEDAIKILYGSTI